MVAFSVKDTIRTARTELQEIQKQVAFATSQTINTMAFNSKMEVDKQIKTRLQRPTRFAQTAVEVLKGNKSTLTSTVKLRDRRGQSETFGHLFEGGVRRGKPYEGVLRRIGALPAGMYTVPGKAAPINVFGNIRKSFLDKVIKELSNKNIPRNSKSTLPPGVWLRTTPAVKAKKGKPGRKRGKELFVVHEQVKASGTGRKATGPKPEAVLLFIKRPVYRRIFDMPDTVKDVINKRFNKEFDMNFKRALATAKRT